MATSGSTDFTQTRDQIIQTALERCQAISLGATPSTANVTAAATTLNSLVKFWQSLGVRLWSIEWATKTFADADLSEVIGTDALNYECIRAHTAAASNRPITGANWSTYWVQRGSSGGTWVTATAYTSLGDFTVAADTIGIDKAFIRDGGNDYPVEIISRDRYFDILTKSNEGKPWYLWFEEGLSPKVHLYPIIDDTSMVLHYARIRRLEDFDAAGDTPDLNVKWLEALQWGVAARMCYSLGLPIQDRSQISKRADEAFMIAKGSDKETQDEEFIKGAY